MGRCRSTSAPAAEGHLPRAAPRRHAPARPPRSRCGRTRSGRRRRVVPPHAGGGAGAAAALGRAESGIRVWALDEVFAGWGAGARRGDEESAPFREGMPAPPALCVAVDRANRLLWTGHKDGRIRSWRMDLDAAATAPAPPPGGAGDGGGSVGGSNHGGPSNAPVFKEALTWQAYGRTPVLSMVVTSYGEHMLPMIL